MENLGRLIAAFDLREVTLVGHDWGGAIGMGAAVAEPGRFARFVMANTAAFRSDRMPWRIRICRAPGLGRLAVQGMNGFVRAALTMATAHPAQLSAAVRAAYLAPYDCWRNRIAVYEFVADIPMSPRHPSYATLEAIERGLPMLRDRPMQLIWGMRDWCFTPRFLARWCELFPDAEVHPLEDAGHWVVEDATEDFVRCVRRFLTDAPAPAAPSPIATHTSSTDFDERN